MDRERVLDQLESLFTMAEHETTSQGERDNALRLAERLMMKYKIERSEVIRETEEIDPISEAFFHMENGYAYSQMILVNTLAELAFCRAYKSGKRLRFVGEKTDIEVAYKLFLSVWNQLWRDCEIDSDNNKPNYVHGRKWKTDYLNMAAYAVQKRVTQLVQERKSNKEEFAIVLVTDDALNKYVEDNLSLRTVSDRRQYSSTAARLGQAAGERAELRSDLIS